MINRYAKVQIGGWGVFQPGNLNGSCVRDLVAGDIFENSPPSSSSLGSLVPLVMVHMNVDEML